MLVLTTQDGVFDYFLVSEDLRDKVQMASIYNEVFGSDHCPVALELDVE